jgi:hypothetical protein
MEIWNGKGEADGLVWFTKDAGEIVGRPYVRRRVATALSRWRFAYSLAQRRAALAATVGSDDWLRTRNRQTVGSLERDAVCVLLERFTSMPAGAL